MKVRKQWLISLLAYTILTTTLGLLHYIITPEDRDIQLFVLVCIWLHSAFTFYYGYKKRGRKVLLLSTSILLWGTLQYLSGTYDAYREGTLKILQLQPLTLAISILFLFVVFYHFVFCFMLFNQNRKQKKARAA